MAPPSTYRRPAPYPPLDRPSRFSINLIYRIRVWDDGWPSGEESHTGRAIFNSAGEQRTTARRPHFFLGCLIVRLNDGYYCLFEYIELYH